MLAEAFNPTDTKKNGPARRQATVWACWTGYSQRRSLNTVYRTTDTISIKPSANG